MYVYLTHNWYTVLQNYHMFYWENHWITRPHIPLFQPCQWPLLIISLDTKGSQIGFPPLPSKPRQPRQELLESHLIKQTPLCCYLRWWVATDTAATGNLPSERRLLGYYELVLTVHGPKTQVKAQVFFLQIT